MTTKRNVLKITNKIKILKNTKRGFRVGSVYYTNRMFDYAFEIALSRSTQKIIKTPL